MTRWCAALAAGCTVVVKPSPETALDAILVAEAAIEAGLPPGVRNILPGHRQAGACLVAHPGVDQVSFTGSTLAGRQVAEVCGRLLRPVNLELGGKSAAIVLDDADLRAETIGRPLATAMLGEVADRRFQVCDLLVELADLLGSPRVVHAAKQRPAASPSRCSRAWSSCERMVQHQRTARRRR